MVAEPPRLWNQMNRWFTSTSTQLWSTRVRVFPCIPDEDEWRLRIGFKERKIFHLGSSYMSQSADWWPIIVTCDYFRKKLCTWPFCEILVLFAIIARCSWRVAQPPVALVVLLELEMPILNTVKHSNGEVLTGRLWRLDTPYFNALPFFSNITLMDEMAGPLQRYFSQGGQEGSYGDLLIVSFFIISWRNDYWNIFH